MFYFLAVDFCPVTESPYKPGQTVNLRIAFILELKTVFVLFQAIAIIELGSLGAEAVDVIRALPVGGEVTRLKGMISEQGEIITFRIDGRV
jgi:hypothetical protein